jgi:hypothetical protein
MHNKKTLFVALGAFFIGFFWALSAQAVCPVCTIAVGAGVGLARYFGVDDTVTGVWVGGLMVSFIVWTLSWFKKKKINFWGIGVFTTLLYYGLVVAPLAWIDIIGHPLNKLWGMDKLLLGIIIGSFVFLGAVNLYEFLKKKNDNHAHFPYEKIVFPVAALAIFSAIFYFITK